MHQNEPEKATEERDQQAFDEAVNRDLKYILEIVAAVGIVAALVLSTVALIKSNSSSTKTVTVAQPVAPAAATTAATPVPAKTISTKIIGGAKLGSDGKKHDYYTVTDFAVKAGQQLKLRIDNTDDVPHNIVSPAASVNILVKPGVHTYTLTVNTAGRFQWFCTIPCDTDANGWAMQHAGFMGGYITVT